MKVHIVSKFGGYSSVPFGCLAGQLHQVHINDLARIAFCIGRDIFSTEAQQGLIGLLAIHSCIVCLQACELAYGKNTAPKLSVGHGVAVSRFYRTQRAVNGVSL